MTISFFVQLYWNKQYLQAFKSSLIEMNCTKKKKLRHILREHVS